MILKIDTNRKKEEYLDFNEYWIFGEIERIHYKNWSYGGDGHYGFDLELFCSTSSPEGVEDKDKDTLHIAIRFEDTKKDVYNILLQGCTCYICNNDGKTIDKLVC